MHASCVCVRESSLYYRLRRAEAAVAMASLAMRRGKQLQQKRGIIVGGGEGGERRKKQPTMEISEFVSSRF